MPKFRYILLIFLVFAICIGSNGVFAFGAGNIPRYVLNILHHCGLGLI
jgi:hypothetical protein